jgi:hypothetical protein
VLVIGEPLSKNEDGDRSPTEATGAKCRGEREDQKETVQANKTVRKPAVSKE